MHVSVNDYIAVLLCAENGQCAMIATAISFDRIEEIADLKLLCQCKMSIYFRAC